MTKFLSSAISIFFLGGGGPLTYAKKKDEINLNKYFKEGRIYKIGLLIEVKFRIKFPGFLNV